MQNTLKTLIFLCVFGYSNAYAVNPLTIQTKVAGLNLGQGAEVWLGPTVDLAKNACYFNEINCKFLWSQTVPVGHDFAGFAKRGESLYFQRSLINNSSITQTYLMTFDWASAEKLTVSLASDGQSKIQSVSITTPLLSRAYPSKYLNLSIALPPGETILLARIDSKDLFKGRLQLWDRKSFTAYLNFERLLIWVLYGISFALALVYIAIYFSSRDLNFFWPAFCLLSLLGFDLHYRGYYLELWEILGLNLHYHPFHVFVTFAFLVNAGLFKLAQALNRENPNSVYYHKVVNFCFQSVLVLAVISIWLETKTAFVLLQAINFLSLLFYAYHFTTTSNLKDRKAPLDALIWLPFLVLYGLFVSQFFGWINRIAIIDLGLMLGLIYLALTLGLTLGYKTLILNRDRQEAIIRQESIKSSLEVARVVQQSILPYKKIEGFEAYHFYKPADSVGGDSFYYDAYQNFLFVSIFDVTGHGISAAIMTGLIAGALKKLFHYEVQVLKSPEQLLKQIALNLNQTILDYNRDQKGHLATVTFGLLDQRTQRFYYLNSGHIPSYLIRPEKIEVLTSPGSPLGFRHDPIFHVKVRTIGDEDKLLFLTDGILENATMDGRPLKEYLLFRELKKHLEHAPHAFGRELENFLLNKFHTVSLEDDMTFLVIGQVVNSSDEMVNYDIQVANG